MKELRSVVINIFNFISSSDLPKFTEKTVITDPPKNMTATIGTDVTLHCNATTDASERRNLEIIWMRYGFPIDYQSENNVALYTVDRSLKITHARIDNTGSYTCNATNGLDWDAVTAHLTVRGKRQSTTVYSVGSATVCRTNKIAPISSRDKLSSWSYIFIFSHCCPSFTANFANISNFANIFLILNYFC